MRRLPAPPLPDWLDDMMPDGATRYRVDVGGLEMHVTELGEGRPVLMVHGNPTWGFLYRRVANALRGAGLRAVMPDLLGLGLSDKPNDPAAHQIERHSDWLGELIDGLDLRELVFVGQDWGGPIGLHALASRAERVAGMVLLNTVVSPPRPGFKPSLFHRLARLPLVSDVLFRHLQFPQVALWLAQGDRASIRGDVARAYRWPLADRSTNLAPLALARMVPDSFEHPSIEPLRRCQEYVSSFEGPIAVVWGERDPVLGSVIGWIERLLPRASVTRTRAGHFLQEEVPDEIAAAIRDVSARAAH